MNDIGLHPDAGRDESGRCEVCDRRGDAYFLEKCADCGHLTCPTCGGDYERGWRCYYCEQGVTGK